MVKNLFKGVSLNLSRQTIFIRFVTEIIIKLGQFITFPLLAKYLGTEGYGVYVLITAILGFLAPIATLGISFNIVRQIAGVKNESYVSSHFSTAILLVGSASLLLGLLVFILAPLLNEAIVKVNWADPSIRISGLLIVATAVDMIISDYYRAMLKVRAISLLQIVQALLMMALIVLALLIGETLFYVLIAQIVVLYAMVLIKFLYLLGDIKMNYKILTWQEVKEIIHFGVPIMTMQVLMWFFNFSDRAIIGYYIDAKSAGIYGAAYSIAMILLMFASPFWYQMYPLMAKHLKNDDPELLAATCRKYMNGFLTVALPVMAGLTILSSSLMVTLANKDFEISRLLFGMIIAGIFLDNLTTISYYIIMLRNEPKAFRNIVILSALVNVGLNIILIPSIGIMGAAAATLVSYVVLDVFLFRKFMSYGYRIGQFYPLRNLMIVLFSCLVMGTVGYWIFSHPIFTPVYHIFITIFISSLIYLLSLSTLHRFKIESIINP